MQLDYSKSVCGFKVSWHCHEQETVFGQMTKLSKMIAQCILLFNAA